MIDGMLRHLSLFIACTVEEELLLVDDIPWRRRKAGSE